MTTARSEQALALTADSASSDRSRLVALLVGMAGLVLLLVVVIPRGRSPR